MKALGTLFALKREFSAAFAISIASCPSAERRDRRCVHGCQNWNFSCDGT
jgi:hypothetical protein